MVELVENRSSLVGRLAALRTVMTRFSDELIGSSFDSLAERGDAPGSTGTTWHFFRAGELPSTVRERHWE
jgi:hypothetical protein